MAELFQIINPRRAEFAAAISTDGDVVTFVAVNVTLETWYGVVTCAAGKLDTATVPDTGCVTGRFETEIDPDTGCVTGRFATDTLPETGCVAGKFSTEIDPSIIRAPDGVVVIFPYTSVGAAGVCGTIRLSR